MNLSLQLTSWIVSYAWNTLVKVRCGLLLRPDATDGGQHQEAGQEHSHPHVLTSRSFRHWSLRGSGVSGNGCPDYLDPWQSRRRSWWSPLCLSLGDNFHKTGQHYPELARAAGETGWLGRAGIHGYWPSASLLRSVATEREETGRSSGRYPAPATETKNKKTY